MGLSTLRIVLFTGIHTELASCDLHRTYGMITRMPEQ